MTGSEEMTFHQRIRLPYRYTAGPAHQAALAGLEAGQLRGSRCERCDIVVAPARPFCPRCHAATGASVRLPDTGTVEGWTTRNRDGAGVTFAMIRLDGADTALLHRVDAAGVELAVGARVVARWASQRRGEITDVDAFVPLGDRPAA